MDILYASTLYPPAIGGAQIHLHCLAKQVQAKGHRVNVLTSASSNRTDWLPLSTFRPEPRRDYAHEGIRVKQLGYPINVRLRLLPAALTYYPLMRPSVAHLARLIGEHVPWPKENPSIVHVSRIGREFLARAMLNYARRKGIPYVLTPNHHPRWHGYLYREYDRIYREADAVIALTEVEKANLVSTKGLDPERVHVTGIGPVLSDEYDAQAFRQRIGWDGPIVLYLGQQLRYKGIGALVEAAPLIFRKHPDIRIVVIGPKSKYSDSVFAAQSDKRLINLGSVDLQTKTSALAACDLLCLPSMQESFGGVYVEGWSLRKPVIGGRIPPIAAVIDEGINGLLTTQNPAEIADTISQLLSDEALRRSMGEAGYQKVREKFSWELIADRTLAIYQSLLSADVPKARHAATVGSASSPMTDLDGSDEPVHARSRPPVTQSPGTRPLTVLLAHNYYTKPGGEDLSYEDEAQLLEAQGHRVYRYSLHSQSIAEMGYLRATREAFWNRNAFDEVRTLIRRVRPDVLHCTNTFPLISPSVFYAARKEGVPVVQALRNYRSQCLNATLVRDGKVCEDCLGSLSYWPGIVHACYRNSHTASAAIAAVSAVHWGMGTCTRGVDLFYTLSEFARQKFIQGGIPAEKIVVKPNVVNPDPGVGPGDGGYAIFAGRLVPEKGIDTMLAAWSLMQDAPPLKILGDGPLAGRVREAASRNPRIQWLGHRPWPEVMSLIGAAKCLVMPSIWYETFGRTIIEAFASGTPVIASRMGAMTELLNHGQTGLFFEPGDAQSLAEAVTRLHRNEAERQAMRLAARKQYESHYTPQINYRLLIGVYERAIKSVAAPVPVARASRLDLDLAQAPT